MTGLGDRWSLGSFGRTTIAWREDRVVEFFVGEEAQRQAREYIDRRIDAEPGTRWHPFHTTLGKSATFLAAAASEVREQYRREWAREPVGIFPRLYVHPDHVDMLAERVVVKPEGVLVA
ncbi:hypothetical protein [Pseudolysinimonas sp.]|uniref:hypothetical protein n=1 Tax=Pseudolysinimonas sp. TaxID=2680009 RepID=UPI003F81E3A4